MRNLKTVSSQDVRFSPEADVVPANILRFYLGFMQPAEASFDRADLQLLDEERRPIAHAFLELPQDLWSADGRRLTVLLAPRRIKRGLSAPPALVVGRYYTIIALFAESCSSKSFLVGEPIVEPLDEAHWLLEKPTIGREDALVVRFDRVVDAVSCDDAVCVHGPMAAPVSTRAKLSSDGMTLRLIPEAPWRKGRHQLFFSHWFEDVCGNRLGEALDHRLDAESRPRGAVISFETRNPGVD